jgi:hypothetical protein
MQRFENDRSAGAELSDGQYHILENLWLSYVQSEREKEGMEPIDLAEGNMGFGPRTDWGTGLGDGMGA